MKENALYFPYIDIPKSKWLTETLIYWDKLSSIVPHEFHNNPNLLSSDMQNLTSAGLVEHILPLDHFSKLHNFEGNFTEIAKIWISVNQNKPFDYSRIHIEKLGNLRHILKNLNLTRDNHSYPWIEIPTPLANIFMSYLATELGKLPDLNATPLTDFNNEIVKMNNTERATIREEILNIVLPIPDGDISIDKLLRFKQDFGHLTMNFRNRIEIECIDILSTKEEYKKEKILGVQRNLKDEIKDIEEAMHTISEDITFNNFLPLIGTSFTGLDSIQTVITAGLTIASTTYQVISTLENNKDNQKKPLAYATLANKYLLN